MKSIIRRFKWMSFALTIMIIGMMFFGFFIPLNNQIRERNNEKLASTIDIYETSINNFIQYSTLSAKISSTDSNNILSINKYYENQISLNELKNDLKRRFNETILLSNASYIERYIDNQKLDSINEKPFDVNFNLTFNEQRWIKSNEITAFLIIYEPMIDKGSLLGYDLYYFNLADYLGMHEVDDISFALYGSLNEVKQVVGNYETKKIEGKTFYESKSCVQVVGQIDHVYGFYLISANKGVLIKDLWTTYANLGAIFVVTIILFVFFNSMTVYFSKKELFKTNEKKDAYKQIADVDSLTKALSRSYFDRWQQTFSESDIDDDWFASLIMIDVDNLKQINDCHGHILGDDVLRDVGSKIAMALRSNDLFVRFGGDEFILILEDCPIDIAENILERIILEVKEINHDLINVEISFGIELLKKGDDIIEVIHLADIKMYENKRSKKSL